MPRPKKLNVSAINITTTPPHSPENYLKLFNLIRDITPPPSGKISKNERMMLAYFAENEGVIIGVMAAYTHIDPNSPWWDSENRKAILDQNGQPVPQTRKGIGPNLREIPFIFFTNGHRIIFDTRGISPNQMFKGLAELFSHQLILSTIGEIFLTVEPEKDVLESMMHTVYSKNKFFIHLTMPNSDTVSDQEEKILNRYRDIGVGKTDQSYVKSGNDEIRPDAELLATASIANQNGYVTISGKDINGDPVSLSTKEYPKKMSATYRDAQYWPAFKKLAQKMLKSVRN